MEEHPVKFKYSNKSAIFQKKKQFGFDRIELLPNFRSSYFKMTTEGITKV